MRPIVNVMSLNITSPRNMSSTASGGSGTLTRPKGNEVDSVSIVDLEKEEWHDWMQWDGGTVEPDCPTAPRAERSLGSTHLPKTSSADPTAPGSAEISIKSSTNQESPSEVAVCIVEEPLGQHSSERPPLTTSHFSSSSSSKISYLPPSPPTSISKTPNRKGCLKTNDPKVVAKRCRKSSHRGYSHNVIEQRYRKNVNEKISCLRESMPSQRGGSNTEEGSALGGVVEGQGEDVDSERSDTRSRQQKYGKAAVITRAIEYIKHLEHHVQRVGDEFALLQTRIGEFEKLPSSGTLAMDGPMGPASSGLEEVKCDILRDIKEEFLQTKPESK